jgi:transcriptional regulator with XRE-family HTH domain
LRSISASTSAIGAGRNYQGAAVPLNRRSLYQIESGQTKMPKLATRQRLARVLRISEQKLFGKDGRQY